MKGWNHYFFGPVSAIRPYLFQKCLLLVIATDAVVLMTERGSRYGIDGFNVAHFAWLDAIHPLPTATWYVGILMLVSLLAYSVCFLDSSRMGLIALAVLWTYAWAMSRHDSYMHHYMISLALVCLIFFPRIQYTDVLPAYVRRRAPDGGGNRAEARDARVNSSPARGDAWFVGSVLGAFLVYRTVDVLAASWIAFFAFFSLVGILLFVYMRRKALPEGPLTSAWAFRLLGANVGVIYIFTSVAKADAEWCGGYTLRQIGRTEEFLAPFVQIAGAIGIPADWFWSILATSVIPLELMIAASYFVSVVQDEPGRKWIPRWCVLAWVLATSLHLNNEMVNISIQWFGYYMMFLAVFFFLPGRVLLALGACIVLPAHWWHERVAKPLLEWGGSQRRKAIVSVTACAALVLVVAAQYIALPGALWSLPAVAAGVILAASLTQLSSLKHLWRPTLAANLAVGAAGLVMCGVVAVSDMQHDYYWILGKEMQHLYPDQPGTQTAALAAYREAEHFGVPSDERHVQLLINMGLAERRLGNPDAAIGHYQSALAIDPSNAHALLNMGVAHEVAGDSEAALSCFRKATTLQPDYVIAYLELARLQELRGDLDAALESMRAAQKLRPNDLEIQQRVTQVIRKSRGMATQSGRRSAGPGGMP